MQGGVTHFETIRDALTRLLTRPAGAFVIFEEPRSQKFVQFAGSREEPLLFDLPSQPLSPAELARAERLLADSGHPIPDVPSPAPDEPIYFNVEFGTDVDGAADLAVAVLREVYGFGEDVELQLTEE